MNNIDLLLHVVVATNCVCITEVMLGGKLYERSAGRRGPFRDRRTTISVSAFVSLLFSGHHDLHVFVRLLLIFISAGAQALSVQC